MTNDERNAKAKERIGSKELREKSFIEELKTINVSDGIPWELLYKHSIPIDIYFKVIERLKEENNE